LIEHVESQNVLPEGCFDNYRPYVDYLEQLVSTSSQSEGDCSESITPIEQALNGEASAKLREIAPVESLRKDGVFFTGSELSHSALSNALKSCDEHTVCMDPACGAGDLLIACASKLPMADSLEDTLRQWGRQLVGRDIHPEFVDAARARVALTAIQRGAWSAMSAPLSLEALLSNIQVGDGLEVCATGVTHVVMNPPFTMMPAPEGCEWKSGKVNSAAVFVEDAVVKAEAETRITAILPEVLCSGSSYEKWRERISSSLNIHSIVRRGRFDGFADVDVFILDATVLDDGLGEMRSEWWRPVRTSQPETTVGELFKVRVGSVVPHRDEEVGNRYPYIHARNVPPWSEVSEVDESRLYSGSVFNAPFIAVRRTSSPSDTFRVTASIVLGDYEMAVENHLIILKPINDDLELCKQAVEMFQTPAVNDWMNERIGCRHLTVSAVKEIPWMFEV